MLPTKPVILSAITCDKGSRSFLTRRRSSRASILLATTCEKPTSGSRCPGNFIGAARPAYLLRRPGGLKVAGRSSSMIPTRHLIERRLPNHVDAHNPGSRRISGGSVRMRWLLAGSLPVRLSGQVFKDTRNAMNHPFLLLCNMRPGLRFPYANGNGWRLLSRYQTRQSLQRLFCFKGAL